MTTVTADFNWVTSDGRLKARATMADGPLAVGGSVRVTDPMEQRSHNAVVQSVDTVLDVAVLTVTWDTEAGAAQ
jgi:hypothetical protein